MGLGWTGSYGATGASDALAEMLKKQELQKQLAFENALKLRREDREDRELTQRAGERADLRGDRDDAQTRELREAYEPATFIADGAPELPRMQKLMSGTLRPVPATIGMGPDFQGPSPDPSETPEMMATGRPGGVVTLPTQKQAATQRDDDRQKEHFHALESAAAASLASLQGQRDNRQENAEADLQRKQALFEQQQAYQAQLVAIKEAGLENSSRGFDIRERLAGITQQLADAKIAKAGVDRPPTGAQSQSLVFFNRMLEAHKTATELEDSMSTGDMAAQSMPTKWLQNFMSSEQGQKFAQAQRSYTEARMRKESGANVTPSEYENDRNMAFRVSNDKPGTVAQKRQSRLTMLRGFAAAAGPALRQFYGDEVNVDELLGATPAAPAPPPPAATPPPGAQLRGRLVPPGSSGPSPNSLMFGGAPPAQPPTAQPAPPPQAPAPTQAAPPQPGMMPSLPPPTGPVGTPSGGPPMSPPPVTRMSDQQPNIINGINYNAPPFRTFPNGKIGKRRPDGTYDGWTPQ